MNKTREQHHTTILVDMGMITEINKKIIFLLVNKRRLEILKQMPPPRTPDYTYTSLSICYNLT